MNLAEETRALQFSQFLEKFLQIHSNQEMKSLERAETVKILNDQA